MEILNWSDRIGSRGRDAWLLLVSGDEIIPFCGRDIRGVAAVRGTDYVKDGKWSYTTYRLQITDGVRHIAGHNGWETGRFTEGLVAAVGCKTPDTWAEVAQALGVSVPSAMDFLREWRPKAAEKLDKVEKSLMELEDSSDSQRDFETVTVSFGTPTNRQISEGYWESPKPIPGYEDAEIRLIDFGGWVEGNIEVVGVHGRVLSVRHASGMHGGSYAVQVAVISSSASEEESKEPSGVMAEALKKAGLR